MQLYVKSFDELGNKELYNILKLRSEIFVVEQNSMYVDMDDEDFDCLHIFYKEKETIEAYLRIINYDNVNNIVKIGRVVSKSRRNGLGTKLLREAISICADKLSAEKILINAQSYIKSFYEKQGFRQISDERNEDGIPHIMMELSI